MQAFIFSFMQELEKIAAVGRYAKNSWSPYPRVQSAFAREINRARAANPLSLRDYFTSMNLNLKKFQKKIPYLKSEKLDLPIVDVAPIKYRKPDLAIQDEINLKKSQENDRPDKKIRSGRGARKFRTLTQPLNFGHLPSYLKGELETRRLRSLRAATKKFLSKPNLVSGAFFYELNKNMTKDTKLPPGLTIGDIGTAVRTIDELDDMPGAPEEINNYRKNLAISKFRSGNKNV